MKKPFLHTKIRKQFTLRLNTDEAARAIRRLGVVVDDSDTDVMPFEFIGSDFEIAGIIERWQGTEARIRFDGELSLAPFNQTWRNWLLLALIIVIVPASIYFVVPLSITFFGIGGAFVYLSFHLLVALLVAALILKPIHYLLMSDPLAQRRWDAQQHMANIAEAILALANESSSSQLSDISEQSTEAQHFSSASLR